MAKIKNMGTATMRFSEGLIVTGSAGIDEHSLVVTGSSRIIGNLIVDSRIGIGTESPDYKLEIGGSMSIGEYIYHRNDTDTFIRFEANKVSIDAGASSGDVILSGSVHAPNGITGSITNAVSDMDGNRILGGLYQLDDGLIQNPNSSYSRIYFPADDTLVETVGPVSHNYKIAPFNGELIKMQVKSIQDFTGKALTASLHVGTGTNNAYSATPAVSVVLNGQAAHSVYTFDFLGRSGTTFSEGNIFGFSLELSENFAGNETIHFTSVVRFNPYS